MSVSLFDHFALEADLGLAHASDDPAPITYKAAKLTVRPLTSGTFEPYRVQRIAITGARTHPSLLVESAAMASVCPPLPTYKPMLQPSILSKGLLSAEQLETVIYAGQQHKSTFSVTEYVKVDPEMPAVPVKKSFRMGYYIADGAGVGKGRQIAAIIKDNFNQGRDRAAWFTVNELLLKDAMRDWADLGGSPTDFRKLSSKSINDTLRFDKGTILFGTYAMLRSRKRDDKGEVSARRLDQFVAALPENFDGVIVFDESGELENADPSITENGGTRASSLQGRIALELQDRLPNARIVYVSATGTSRVDGLAYASRLNLWGADTGFPDRKTFMHAMTMGGTAALEVICRELKALGRMCARTLSYEGVQYERITHELDPAQIDMWNAYTRTWRMIEQGFLEELLRQKAISPPTKGKLEVESISGSPLGRLRGITQSAKQRFFAQALMSMKWPSTQAYIRSQLDAGKAVVIQLTHTNESQMNRALDAFEGDDLDELELSHREFLVKFVRENYPTSQFESYFEDDKVRVRVLNGPDGKPLIDLGATERREALIAQIEELVFPETILELIHDAFGDTVAEVTGRKRKLVHQIGSGGARERVLVKRGAGESAREIEAFLSDRKHLLVFTEGCAGMGQSFHSDIRYRNQRQRMHIFLEMSWSASKALQGCGRTLRTGQVNLPCYVFVSTTVPGEKRFSSTPARRIAALGALTRGQREAADNGLFRAQDNLETIYAERALRTLMADINAGTVPEIERSTFFFQTGIDVSNVQVLESTECSWPPKKNNLGHVRIPKFLNRMLSSDIAADGGFQALLMDAFLERMEVIIEQEIAAGTFDIGMETFKPLSLRIVDKEKLHVDSKTKATAELLTLAVKDQPWDWNSFDDALAKIGFYNEMRREWLHETGAPTAPPDACFMVEESKNEIALHIPVLHERPTLNPVIRLICPVGDRTRFTENGKTYTPVSSVNEARDRWAAAHASRKLTERTLYAVTGTLLSVWAKLPASLPCVYRMQTDDGERLLARIIRSDEIDETCAKFGLTLPEAA